MGLMTSEYQTAKFKEPVNLLKFWEIKWNTPEREYEVALKSLRDQLEVVLSNKTNVGTLAIETREPQPITDKP